MQFLSFLFLFSPLLSILLPRQREREQQEEILHYHDSSKEFFNNAQNSILSNIYLFSGRGNVCMKQRAVPLCV